jgi:hypothetical protein
MSSEKKLETRNQRIVSGVFMFFILIFTFVLTYYSFNLSSSLQNLRDKSNPSITSYTNAFNSWSIALIALGMLILIITIIGIILSPYIIVAFLFLFLLVLIALFVYTSIALNALLGTSDYTNYTSNFEQGLNAAIIILIISALLILAIVIFCYFMLKSLSKAGGLESELDYVISKFQPDEIEKYNEQVEYNKRLVLAEAQGAETLGEEVGQETQLSKQELKEIQDIELQTKAKLQFLKQHPDIAQDFIEEIKSKSKDEIQNLYFLSEQYKLNIKNPETAKAQQDLVLYKAATEMNQQEMKKTNKSPSKIKVKFEKKDLQAKIKEIKNTGSPVSKFEKTVELFQGTPKKLQNFVAENLLPSTPVSRQNYVDSTDSIDSN